MNNENRIYPDFVPNQVLTNVQLNQLRNYLDEQDRRGQVRLVGTGIVCGLDVTHDSTPAVDISDGFGISSDGYLIELVHDTLTRRTHWIDYTDPDRDQDGSLAYAPWHGSKDGKKQIDIIELVEETQGATKLTLDKLEGRVLVLYLEKNRMTLDSCLVTDCDSKGINVRLMVRVLLVEKEKLLKVPECPSARGRLIRIPRLNTVLNLAEVKAGQQINDGYGRILENMFDEMVEKLTTVYMQYATALGLKAGLESSFGPEPDKSIPEMIKERLTAVLESPNQYSWDIFNDIAQAYNEFIHAACEVILPCLQEYEFPRHLMLTAFDDGGYRNEFTPSPVRNMAQGHMEIAGKLMIRLLLMIRTIDLKTEQDISITPSHTPLYPLGKRALPIYFSPDIEPFWQPRTCCTVEDVWSSHFQNEAKTFPYAEASMLRIEGHWGRSCKEAADIIREIQRRLNLEFDLIDLNIKETDEKKESLARLARDYPGMEHMAGVEKGGTFILVCEDDRLVADFSLSGQVHCCRYLDREPAPKTGQIGGRFIDERGGALVNGQVILKLSGTPSRWETTTDEKASFIFSDLSAGNYTLAASITLPERGTLTSDTVPVTLAQGEQKEVILTGKPIQVEPGTIRGQTLDKTGGPVPNAQVHLNPGGNTTITGEKGEFEFKALNPGRYTIQALITVRLGTGIKRFKTDTVTVDLRAGATITQDLVFKEYQPEAPPTTGNLDIHLWDPVGRKTISRAAITIQHTSIRTMKKTLDKANTEKGHFLFSELSPGKYMVKASVPGIALGREKILTVKAGETIRETWELRNPPIG